MSTADDFHTATRPLVADTITGTRSFAVDSLGRLTGVSHPSVWRPGVNEATCRRPSDATWRLTLDRLSYFGSPTPARLATPEETPEETTEPHTPGSKGCECGFWAYFDGSDDFAEHGRITAVVQGSGVTTVGRKGFRSERAEIVALVNPNSRAGVLHRAWHRFGRWSENPLVAFATAFVGYLVGFGAAAHLNAPGWLRVAAGLAVAAPLIVLSFFAVLHVDECERGRDACIPWDKVRRNYPDVPVYPTLAAALAEHPLNHQPVEITPDTVEDFWERPA